VAIRILAIGDVVGRPGRRFLRSRLPEVVARENVEFVIVNGENAASGLGITRALAKEIHAAGADVITTGDHVWRRQDVRQALVADRNLLRPHNFPAGAPGAGVVVTRTRSGVPVRVVNLLGRIFMDPVDCPFECMERILQESREPAVTIVDMHAEATSEKGALAWAADGRITAVVGTHTHVQTADERILERGTAFITDLGMTGAVRSVLGRKVEQVVEKFRSRIYVAMDVADGEMQMGGAVITVEPETGRALDIQRVTERGYIE
jgi:metallophosphoesterase (TIGR00282 family)